MYLEGKKDEGNVRQLSLFVQCAHCAAVTPSHSTQAKRRSYRDSVPFVQFGEKFLKRERFSISIRESPGAASVTGRTISVNKPSETVRTCS